MREVSDKIKRLEKKSMVLEPGATERKRLLDQVNSYSDAFYRRTADGPAYTESGDDTFLEKFPLKEEGESIEKLLEVFEKSVEKPGINPASGGHLGYIPGGGIYPSALGDYLAAVTNRYAGIYFANPGAVRMEQMMIEWLCSIIPFPKTAGGTLCSGGSIANLTGITAARDKHGVEGSSVEKAVVYLTVQAHHSLHKALRIAGLSRCKWKTIPVGDDFKMRVEKLKEAVKEDLASGLNPFLVMSTAGTTDTGVVDPMAEISAICQEYGLWHHIDAAYGGCFALVENLKPHFKGWELANSITIDPHKGLFLPYGTGALLIKNPELLLKSHHYLANYMRDAQNEDQLLSPADLSPELSRHFKGLRMWLPLKLFGLGPFKAALEEKHLLASFFHQKIGELGFETGPTPTLSVVIYRYTKGLDQEEINEFNQALIKQCHQDGRV
ncbi:MAG: aminotransferase class V-fold PLP-dependent enzyme, partial [Saprospirales bacterium]